MTFSPRIICCYLFPITRYGYPPPAKDSLKYIEEMAEMGFQSIELEGIREGHIIQVYDQRFLLAEKLQELKVRLPYYCVVLPELSAASSALRKHALTLFRKGCETAHVLGARGVLDNAPLPPYNFPANIPVARHFDEDVLLNARIPEDIHWPEYWRNMISTYQQACEIAAEYGLDYHMHPCLGVMGATTDAWLYFSEAVNRPNLRFNFDTANLYYLKENLSLALIRLQDHIDYIHISDNGGEKIEHLIPGTSSIQWDSFFNTLRQIEFKGDFGIDVGGAESNIGDIREAYVESARWMQEKL